MTQAMIRFLERKGVVKIPQEVVPKDNITIRLPSEHDDTFKLPPADVSPRNVFTASSKLEELPEDLVIDCLARLQDGVKVTPMEASEALKQYRKFQVEMGRLQTLINRPSRYPRMTCSLYMQEKSFKDRTKKIIEAKEEEIVKLKQKVAEMSLRLSAILGTQVVEVDYKKSDLTDSVKPTKIAEDFRAIYDNEYQTAFEEMEVGMEEAKVLVYLGKVTWLAYEFAQDMAEQQLEDMMKKEQEILRIMCKPSYEEKTRRKPIVADGIAPRKFERDETLQLMKDFRRCLARTSVPRVKQIFLTLMTRTPPEKGGTVTDGLKKYILAVIEQVYLMCIQDPPMHLEWVRFGDMLDEEKYKAFKGEGTKVVGTIWPVVLRHKGGPVMSRGVADVMYGQVIGPKNVETRRYSHFLYQ